MRRRPWAAFDTPTTYDGDRLPLCARHVVRLPILNWGLALLLAAIAGLLFVLTWESERRDEISPAWSCATGHPQGVWQLAITSDGRKLATGGIDGAVVIWEVGKGALSVLTDDRPSIVQCLAFSPDSATLAAGYDGFEVVLWNVATGRETGDIPWMPKSVPVPGFLARRQDPGIRRRGINHSNLGCRDGKDQDRLG